MRTCPDVLGAMAEEDGLVSDWAYGFAWTRRSQDVLSPEGVVR